MVYLPLWAHLQALSSLFTAPHYFAFIFCPPNILSSFSSWGLFLCWNVFSWSSFSSFGLSSGMTSLERSPLTTQCMEASSQFCLSHYFICVFPVVLVTAWNCFICLQAISRIWPLLAPPLLPPWAEPPVTRMALVASAVLSSFHPYSPRNNVFSKHQPEEKRSQSMWGLHYSQSKTQSICKWCTRPSWSRPLWPLTVSPNVFLLTYFNTCNWSPCYSLIKPHLLLPQLVALHWRIPFKHSVASIYLSYLLLLAYSQNIWSTR